MHRALPFVSLAVLLLSGCGGGGSSPASGVPGFNSPTGVQQFTVQRALVQQSLALITGASTVETFGDGVGYATIVLSRTRRALAFRRPQTASCVGGEEDSSNAINATTESLTIALFYDAACTEPESLGQYTLTTTSATAFSITGNVTLYAMSGAVDGYNTLSLSFNVPSQGATSFILQSSEASAQGSPPFANLAANCSLLPSGSESCAVAVDDHAPALNADNAVAESIATTLTESGASISATVSGSGSAFVGGLNATNITQQGGSGWTITGGTKVDSTNFSASYSYSGSSAVQTATLTIDDSANGGTVTVTYNQSSQTFTGTLTQNSDGSTLATFTVDVTGSGTITYSSGATGTISNSVITS